jgi:hypothetical protein
MKVKGILVFRSLQTMAQLIGLTVEVVLHRVEHHPFKLDSTLLHIASLIPTAWPIYDTTSSFCLIHPENSQYMLKRSNSLNLWCSLIQKAKIMQQWLFLFLDAYLCMGLY